MIGKIVRFFPSMRDLDEALRANDVARTVAQAVDPGMTDGARRRRRAIRVLMEMENDASSAALEAMLEDDLGGAGNYLIIETLHDRRIRDAVPLLVRASLADHEESAERPFVVVPAIRATGDLASAGEVEPSVLAAWLDDPSHIARLAATEAIGKLRERRVRSQLAEVMSKDVNANVRANAALALADLRMAEDLDAIARAIEAEPHRATRRRLVRIHELLARRTQVT